MMETTIQTEKGVCTTTPFRTIQIHPSRKCNLFCLHCYSSSAPQLHDMLSIEALKPFLEYAYGQGFNNISISGGEPFLYKDLQALLVFSKSLGYQNAVASNGMLLNSERNRRILESVDLIAVSIDGKPELHNRIRNQEAAFDKMMAGIAVLKSMQKAFGFIHTITQESWESLLWLGRFAAEQGASLLQLHPLELYGRAEINMAGSSVDEILAHRAFILANYLQAKYADTMVVQLDLMHREYIAFFPQAVNTFTRQCAEQGRLSDILDTIIVDEKGQILPVAYGFDPSFTIGNVYQFHDGIFESYLARKKGVLQELFNQTMDDIVQHTTEDIVNWNERLVRASRHATMAV